MRFNISVNEKVFVSVGDLTAELNFKTKFNMTTKDDLKDETANSTNTVLSEVFAAQFHDNNYKPHEIKGKSLAQIKRKLSKLDVCGSAAIWKTDDKDFPITYYKPSWRRIENLR
jgi:hypothetical protein